MVPTSSLPHGCDGHDGNIPASVRGHKKVLVIGCRFTRFVIAIPTKDDTASTIASILFEGWISCFGPPIRLLSAQGSQQYLLWFATYANALGRKK
jgi:hypothetical protein